MIYLDSNVFIYAATDNGPQGRAAAKVLTKALRKGACTASLTADEVLWAVTKKLGRDLAAEKVRQLLELDLTIASVDKKDIEAALVHFGDGLDPRDAIHAAVAVRAGCTSLASTDSTFGKVKGLRHAAY